MNARSLWTYSRRILEYRLGGGDGGYRTAPAAREALAPLARQAARAGRLILVGLGRGQALRDLEAVLPADVSLTVCELFPDQARSVAALPPDSGGRTRLVVDTSAPALVLLLLGAGLVPAGTACALNPEVAAPEARAAFRKLQRLWAGLEPVARTDPAGPADISLAAVLHPDEPDLDGFFAALPRLGRELVVVWDAPSPPRDLPPSLADLPMPVRHLAHPLGADFAAQRNRMLAACRGPWVLFLDGDERLDPRLENLLPVLAGQDRCGSWAFVRLGLAAGGVKMGFGLWPDLQVRLFRKTPDVRFVRPVHERLEGLEGPTGLVVGGAIRHLSDLLKDPEALARKHALFDRAAGVTGLHRRNPEYPILPEEFFRPDPEAAALWSLPPGARI